MEMSTYVIGDVHNSLSKLEQMLELIAPTANDFLYFLGDLFDRGGADPNPVGVYFKFLEINAQCAWIRGNHDNMLAEYIHRYYGTPVKKRDAIEPYRYNSFALMRDRLVEADLLNIAEQIMNLPLQAELEIDGEKYLLAHAMTFDPSQDGMIPEACMEGVALMDDYLHEGVEGYISMIGHMDSAYMCNADYGRYLDGRSNSIWENAKKNLYLLDCGCGLPNGRLAGICLETGARYYV